MSSDCVLRQSHFSVTQLRCVFVLDVVQCRLLVGKRNHRAYRVGSHFAVLEAPATISISGIDAVAEVLRGDFRSFLLISWLQVHRQ